MIIDPANAAALSTQAKEQRPHVASQPGPEPPGGQPPVSPAGQTSATGPGVVAHLSAAALLIARAVTSAEQAADPSPAKPKDKEKRKEERPEDRGQEGRPGRGTRVDTSV